MLWGFKAWRIIPAIMVTIYKYKSNNRCVWKHKCITSLVQEKSCWKGIRSPFYYAWGRTNKKYSITWIINPYQQKNRKKVEEGGVLAHMSSLELRPNFQHEYALCQVFLNLTKQWRIIYTMTPIFCLSNCQLYILGRKYH